MSPFFASSPWLLKQMEVRTYNHTCPSPLGGVRCVVSFHLSINPSAHQPSHALIHPPVRLSFPHPVDVSALIVRAILSHPSARPPVYWWFIHAGSEYEGYVSPATMQSCRAGAEMLGMPYFYLDHPSCLSATFCSSSTCSISDFSGGNCCSNYGDF